METLGPSPSFNPNEKRVILAVHGGAGIILRDNLSTKLESHYRTALIDALNAGYSVLTNAKNKENERCDKNSSASIAVDAAEAAVRSLEDCPLFNAGRGSVFGNDGKIRMDASIMACYLDLPIVLSEENGHSSNSTIKPISPHQITRQRKYPPRPHPRAGSVAGVSNVQNPISLARAVMERSPHVMLVGKGAEDFGRSLPCDAGVNFQPDEYFWTERRWNQLVNVREEEARHQQNNSVSAELGMNKMMVQLDHSDNQNEKTNQSKCKTNERVDGLEKRKFGTVGCVALYLPTLSDQSNETHDENMEMQISSRAQLASATSTGGMTNVRHHRVGDSPIIGAGTWANSLCAVSCTGHGEWFIRCAAAHDVAARLEYKHGYGTNETSSSNRNVEALKNAVNEVVFGTLMGDGVGDDHCNGGDGGVIALDREGNFVGEMNCPGMYHGWVYEDGEMVTKIFWDERAETLSNDVSMT
ncbi:hypothetical protein ACHAXS_010040 [Conticribra weissflogii]